MQLQLVVFQQQCYSQSCHKSPISTCGTGPGQSVMSSRLKLRTTHLSISLRKGPWKRSGGRSTLLHLISISFLKVTSHRLRLHIYCLCPLLYFTLLLMESYKWVPIASWKYFSSFMLNFKSHRVLRTLLLFERGNQTMKTSHHTHRQNMCQYNHKYRESTGKWADMTEIRPSRMNLETIRCQTAINDNIKMDKCASLVPFRLNISFSSL